MPPRGKFNSESAWARITSWRLANCGPPGGCGRASSKRAAVRRPQARCESTPVPQARADERDPYVNLLRNTVGVFAAGIGGAESITSVPFDATVGLPDDFSRRIARNTLLVLQEEAHLHRVIDPPGGSWFLDRLTLQLAEKAWGIFQEIERQAACSRR